MPSYKIVNVNGPREWEGQYGKNHSFDLDLEGVDKPVELTQKPDKPRPQPGEQINLNLEPHPRFDGKLKGKREYQGGGGFGGGPRPEDPVRSKRITRQHSQHMALLYIAATGKELASWGEFQTIVDRFDRDVEDTAMGRRQDVQRTGESDIPNAA